MFNIHYLGFFTIGNEAVSFSYLLYLSSINHITGIIRNGDTWINLTIKKMPYSRFFRLHGVLLSCARLRFRLLLSSADMLTLRLQNYIYFLKLANILAIFFLFMTHWQRKTIKNAKTADRNQLIVVSFTVFICLFSFSCV